MKQKLMKAHQQLVEYYQTRFDNSLLDRQEKDKTSRYCPLCIVAKRGGSCYDCTYYRIDPTSFFNPCVDYWKLKEMCTSNYMEYTAEQLQDKIAFHKEWVETYKKEIEDENKSSAL